jgi:hypothetical protein
MTREIDRRICLLAMMGRGRAIFVTGLAEKPDLCVLRPILVIFQGLGSAPIASAILSGINLLESFAGPFTSS